MGITYGDYLIDSGYRELTPEQENEMSTCIAAHTNPGAEYPGYINFTREDDGTVTIHFRGDPSKIEDAVREGATATLKLSAQDFAVFIAEAANRPVW